MICNNCHQEIGNANGLCPKCGAPIASPQQPVQQVAPPQPPQPKKSKKGLYISLGVAAAVAVIAVAGWLFLRKSSDSSYLEKMIPATASAVVRVDAAQLAEKIGLEIDGMDIKLPKRVMDLTGANADDIQEFLGKIKESGINPLGAIYGFSTNESLNAALLVPLFDQDKAKDFIEKEVGESFSKKDDSYFFTDGEAIVMLKNKALLVGFANDNAKNSESLQKLASDLMDGKQESIAKNSAITSTLHNNKAISLYADNEKIQGLLNENPDYKKAMRDNPFALLLSSISSTSMALDVDDNQFTLTTDLGTKDKDYENFMGAIFHPASNDFLDYMPAGCNIMVAAGVNGKKIASMEQIAFLLNNLPDELKTVIESINGTIAAGGIFDSKNPETIPYTILIGSDKPDALLGIVKMFAFALGDVGVAGNYVYITTNQQVKKGDFSAPAECKDLFKNNWLGLYSSVGVSSFEFNTSWGFSSAKNTKFSFYINENGKKMKPIEWLVAFDEVQKQFKVFNNNTSNDFAFDEDADASGESNDDF